MELRDFAARELLLKVIRRGGRHWVIAWTLVACCALAAVAYWTRAPEWTAIPYILLGAPGLLALLFVPFGLRSALRNLLQPAEHPFCRAIIDGRITRVERTSGSYPGVGVWIGEDGIGLSVLHDEHQPLFDALRAHFPGAEVREIKVVVQQM